MPSARAIPQPPGTAEQLLDRLDDLAARLDQFEQRAARRHTLTEALISIHAVLPLRAPLPAFEGDRIAADCAKILLNCVFSSRPRVIVEFGSGLSTLILGYALQRTASDGPAFRPRIISFDHLPAFAQQTRDNLRRHGLDTIAAIVDAPLARVSHATLGHDLPAEMTREPHAFYDPAEVRGALDLHGIGAGVGREPIDLLFVDGPAGGLHEPLSRWPAVPLVADRLAQSCTIVLDDANRPGERAVREAWTRRFPALAPDPIVPTLKGTALFRGCAAS